MRLLVLRTVLVATDLGEPSRKAVEGARHLAAAADAELHVVYVANDAAPDPARVYEFIGRCGIAVDEASVHAVAGDPADAIGRFAESISADVIVLGPHEHPGEGAASLRPARAVATYTAVPCLVVSDFTIPLRRVVVPVDLSETSRGALLVGLSWASALRAARTRTGSGATLTALYVISRDARPHDRASIDAALTRQIRHLRETAGTWSNVAIDYTVVADDDVPGAVGRYAANDGSDLIVIGTRGGGLDAVARVGSVAAALVEATTIPTLLVPPAVWLELGRVRPRQRRRSRTSPRTTR
jgi:nucleotide-binding universal stress UspA family protein